MAKANLIDTFCHPAGWPGEEVFETHKYFDPKHRVLQHHNNPFSAHAFRVIKFQPSYMLFDTFVIGNHAWKDFILSFPKVRMH